MSRHGVLVKLLKKKPARRLCEVVRLQIYEKLLTTPSNCGASTLQCDVPLTANGPSNKPTPVV
ncbi:hypothetical protein L210DRAFT_941517 [Boletus edulis BED1]|uniref:Uncharacterized protein n=1 Tax=Boletus edulis BED1 TaxID=1328754 RepID=A0AAD4GCU9_BOLED|nr:hypothetical protein L210DRAFT_941517 [Boletus edulis BED1]